MIDYDAIYKCRECGYECKFDNIPVVMIDSGLRPHFEDREPPQYEHECPECGQRDTFDEKENDDATEGV